MPVNRGERTLQVAEQVARVLLQHELPSAMIGAVAMAVHLFPRATKDLDLAISIDPFPRIRRVEERLRSEGFHAEFEAPDAEDSLGGVLRVTGDDFDLIEVVNFHNLWRGADHASALASEALGAALEFEPGSPLKVVSLPYLIALKLYAGGRKSMLDVLELLERNFIFGWFVVEV